jgi:hypothetical protein
MIDMILFYSHKKSDKVQGAKNYKSLLKVKVKKMKNTTVHPC